MAAPLADADHLIIVPDGPLISLPFETLVTAKPDPDAVEDYRRVHWLGIEKAIHAYNAAL